MASLIEGRYTGHLLSFERGPFLVKKRIILPQYIADGDYLIDLYLHQPIIQDFFSAQNCMLLHIEGYYNQYARPLVLRDEGFLGLQSK